MLFATASAAQGVKFNRDLSPAEGLIKPQEKPCRDEICLNGSWDFQPVPVPTDWVSGKGIPPTLVDPDAAKWESTKIKIPSPWNVNEWGGGSKVGPGTNLPYAPSSVYYPSYPQNWAQVKIGWLRRKFSVPATWKNKRLIIHFEAVAGECVVLVNGKEKARNMDAYLPFDVDITNDIKPDADNELLVGIRSRRLFDKKNDLYTKMSATYPPGSNTHDLIGIWQDVFLQALPAVRVDSVFAKPAVDKNELEFEVKLINESSKSAQISLNCLIKEWVNDKTEDALTAAEINWHLGETAMQLTSNKLTLAAGETKTIIIKSKVNNALKLWSPEHPNLYTAVFNIVQNGKTVDVKTERFGWRTFSINGKFFYLNGEKIQCFGDLQHPFGPYITSRRFAWAWYKMIKDFGGNAVRPHAQPWPRVYYDLADEMGLVVLDEDALFGSSIALNLEEDITWQRTEQEINRLILRDRNHPSVFGWSVGNEIFAIALLNKPAPEVAKVWDNKLVKLAQYAASLDNTRPVVTSDGDKDMDGNMPVWSKHFGHGLKLDQVPDINKPIIIGESGATYYGKPRELFQFIGLKSYGTYEQRNEALAIDVYQNVVKMAKPMLAYFSPSEVCWFGIEHMNLGYHDYSRLPDERDGIFPAKPYEEGKPGYQYERIPPYVTTFNPGLDPELPVYKPLAMFEALKAALAKGGPVASPWDHFQDTSWQKPVYPEPAYNKAVLIASPDSKLAGLLNRMGIDIAAGKEKASLIIIDGDNASAEELGINKKIIDEVHSSGGLVLVFVSKGQPSTAATQLLPSDLKFIPYQTTALQGNIQNAVGKLFNLRDGYFSEMNGDKFMLKQAIGGDILKQGSVVISPAKTDWYLFSGAPENRKCAQELLYEHLEKPQAAAVLTTNFGHGTMAVSALDYTINTPEANIFWQKLFKAMAIKQDKSEGGKKDGNKKHDLLMDGPVN
ncbi:MAG TPA: glycoside hydrolase family 2 TIM barrel-domain containing protein [Mucilaginibacter sp.]|jgi:beta-galactosidase